MDAGNRLGVGAEGPATGACGHGTARRGTAGCDGRWNCCPLDDDAWFAIKGDDEMGTTGEACLDTADCCMLVAGANPRVPLVASFRPNETSIPQDSSCISPFINASNGSIPASLTGRVNSVLRTSFPVIKFLPTPSSCNAQLTSPLPVHTACSLSLAEPRLELIPGKGDDGREGRK